MISVERMTITGHNRLSARRMSGVGILTRDATNKSEKAEREENVRCGNTYT